MPTSSASQRPHRGLFELVWGAQSFVIKWSADVEAVRDTPGPPPDGGPPMWLDPSDRGRANASFDQMAQSIPNYEVRRGDAVHLEMRRGTGRQCAVHAAGTTRLRPVPKQSEVQRLLVTVARATIHCSPISPRAISAHPPIRAYHTIPNSGRTSVATSPIRWVRPMSTPASPASSPGVICSVVRHRWTPDGSSWGRGACRTFPGTDAAMSTSGPIRRS